MGSSIFFFSHSNFLTFASSPTDSIDLAPVVRMPEEVVSDNGPQFVSNEFAEFMNKNGIKHTQEHTLVPPYPGA